MTRMTTLITTACGLPAMAGLLQAQNTGIASLSVAVGPEAPLTVTIGTTLAIASTLFGGPFAGSGGGANFENPGFPLAIRVIPPVRIVQ